MASSPFHGLHGHAVTVLRPGVALVCGGVNGERIENFDAVLLQKFAKMFDGHSKNIFINFANCATYKIRNSSNNIRLFIANSQ